MHILLRWRRVLLLLARARVLQEHLTGVKGLEFVVGDFGIVHAVQERCVSGVIFAPEIIRDCLC